MLTQTQMLTSFPLVDVSEMNSDSDVRLIDAKRLTDSTKYTARVLNIVHSDWIMIYIYSN